MPTLETAQLWLTQSTLLLEARPSTTRITTKYTLPRESKSKSNPATEGALAPAPVATLTLKTYDPISGTTLKYKTNKAAEVGRLAQIMGRLARPMAGLPEVKEDVVMGEGGDAAAGSGVATPAVEAEKTPAAGQSGKSNAGGGGGGGKKGKKKGKK